MHLIYDARGEQVPAGQPRRAHRPRHAVPDQLQPRLRAHESANPANGPDMTVNSIDGQRPRRRRSRSCSRPTPATRTGRTTPTRWRTRPRRSTRSAARRTTRCPRPARPSRDTGAAANAQNGDAVPGQQAGDHAVPDPDHGRHRLHRDGPLHRHVRACTTTATAPPRAGSERLPPGDGGFVTTEPVGTEDWMPLNDHPTRQADLRLLRHGQRRPDARSRTACCMST